MTDKRRAQSPNLSDEAGRSDLPEERTQRSDVDPPGADGLPAGTGTERSVDYERSTTSGRRSAGAGTGPGLSSGRGNKQ